MRFPILFNLFASISTRSYGFNEGACVYREFNAATDDVQMHGAPTKCCEAGLSSTELAEMRAEQARQQFIRSPAAPARSVMRPTNLNECDPAISYSFNEFACVYRTVDASGEPVMHGAPRKCCEAGLTAQELAEMRAAEQASL